MELLQKITKTSNLIDDFILSSSCIAKILYFLSLTTKNSEIVVNINTIKLVTFSPTGNSTKIAKSIAKGIKAPIEHIDLTPPAAKTQSYEDFHDELTIIAVPVYAGRVPNEAAYRLRKLRGKKGIPRTKPEGKKTPAVIVVTYGNRAYEDALRELGDIVSEVGFKPIAAAAFVCEHSWSVPEKPTAHGRPDSDDLTKAETFGKKIKEKYEKAETVESIPSVVSPGTNPYSLAMRGHLTPYDFGEVPTPYTDEKICSKCGECVDVCPMASISIKNVVSNPSPMVGYNVQVVSTEDSSCIWCCACVKNCPTGARVMSARILMSQESLYKNYPERKDPETYL
jgi:ferredoxin